MMFDLPTRGTEVRIPSLLDRGNDVEVVFAYARSSKIAVLTVRSDSDMAAAKNNGLDNAEPRTPENTTPTSFRQWCEEVLKPAVVR